MHLDTKTHAWWHGAEAIGHGLVNVSKVAEYYQGTGVRGLTQDLIPVDVLHRDYRSFGSRTNGVVERVARRGLSVHYLGSGSRGAGAGAGAGGGRGGGRRRGI